MSHTMRYVNHENDILVIVEAPFGMIMPDTIQGLYRKDGNAENPLLPVTLTYQGIQGWK